MREFEESVFRYAKNHDMFPAPGLVLVALSGGGDSVALVRCLAAISDRLGITVRAAHLNHSLRGGESDGDDAFCRELCNSLGIPLTVGRLPENALHGTGESLETSARRARREFLLTLAKEVGAFRIATGHTSDDRAETVLQRMIRGTGPSGLAGIRPVQGVFVRPFLGEDRKSVRGYLKAMDVTWREDSTNTDTRIFRNRVRHDLIPLLEKGYSPGVAGALNRLAELSRVDEEYFDERVGEAVRECLIYGDSGKILLDGGALGRYHISLRRRMVRLCLERLGGEGRDTDMGEVERILRLADNNKGEICSADGVRVGAGGGIVAFAAGVVEYGPLSLMMPGTTRIPGNGLIVASDIVSGECPDWDTSIAVAPDIVKRYGPLTFGPALHGEYMLTSGTAGSRKVFDLLAACGVPKILRDAVPVVRAGGVPVWIPGAGYAECLRDGASQAGTMVLSYREGPAWRRLLRTQRVKNRRPHGIPPDAGAAPIRDCS